MSKLKSIFIQASLVFLWAFFTMLGTVAHADTPYYLEIRQNAPFEKLIKAVGWTSTTTVALASGSPALPLGITIAHNGVLSGNGQTLSGTYQFRLETTGTSWISHTFPGPFTQRDPYIQVTLDVAPITDTFVKPDSFHKIGHFTTNQITTAIQLSSPNPFTGSNFTNSIISYPTNAGNGPFPIFFLIPGSEFASIHYVSLLNRIASWGYVAVSNDHTSPTGSNQLGTGNLNETMSLIHHIKETLFYFDSPLGQMFHADITNYVVGGHSNAGQASLFSQYFLGHLKGVIQIDSQLAFLNFTGLWPIAVAGAPIYLEQFRRIPILRVFAHAYLALGSRAGMDEGFQTGSSYSVGHNGTHQGFTDGCTNTYGCPTISERERDLPFTTSYILAFLERYTKQDWHAAAGFLYGPWAQQRSGEVETPMNQGITYSFNRRLNDVNSSFSIDNFNDTNVSQNTLGMVVSQNIESVDQPRVGPVPSYYGFSTVEALSSTFNFVRDLVGFTAGKFHTQSLGIFNAVSYSHLLFEIKQLNPNETNTSQNLTIKLRDTSGRETQHIPIESLFPNIGGDITISVPLDRPLRQAGIAKNSLSSMSIYSNSNGIAPRFNLDNIRYEKLGDCASTSSVMPKSLSAYAIPRQNGTIMALTACGNRLGPGGLQLKVVNAPGTSVTFRISPTINVLPFLDGYTVPGSQGLVTFQVPVINGEANFTLPSTFLAYQTLYMQVLAVDSNGTILSNALKDELSQ
ncbi:MAG: hypothetical protein SGJ02_00955 [bacterium]|nr:hypothetical protein [bacterium]